MKNRYLEEVTELGEKYFLGVTRFTTSAFMRAKLGETLQQRGVAPHIFESETEARAAIRETINRM